MNRALLVLGPLLPLVFALVLRQDPVQTPLPEGVVARVDGQDLLLTDYKDYLWRQTGKRLLPQWIDDRLIEGACARFGVTLDDAELARRVKERLDQLMQGREPAVVDQEMRARGFSLETLRDNLLTEMTRNLRAEGLVRATRVATDERLRMVFDSDYGPGGVKVELRQVLCMPHVLRTELIRAGRDPASLSQEAMRADALAMAETALAALQGGEEFGAVAAQYSHDQASSQSGGVIPAFRPGLYGAEFAAAVEALEVGRFSAVIESSAGFHVVQVTARAVTEFHRVRSALVEKVMSAEPSWQEREELLAGLRAQAKIELW